MRRAKYEGEVSRPGTEGLEPIFISMEDLQWMLNCGKTKAFALVGSGEIESVTDGRRRLPVLESARAYATKLREQAKASMQEAA